mmetsp:Transcript_7824/g.20675  ORF Transcript_7824/g.20675 Transcript_7824/m.20675 type:complete len:297 (-) Transcript_7824:358-1248(-)
MLVRIDLVQRAHNHKAVVHAKTQNEQRQHLVHRSKKEPKRRRQSVRGAEREPNGTEQNQTRHPTRVHKVELAQKQQRVNDQQQKSNGEQRDVTSKRFRQRVFLAACALKHKVDLVRLVRNHVLGPLVLPRLRIDVHVFAIHNLDVALQQLRDAVRAHVQRVVRAADLRDNVLFLHRNAVPRRVRAVREDLPDLRVGQRFELGLDGAQEVWLPARVVSEKRAVEEQVEHRERPTKREPRAVRRREAQRLERDGLFRAFDGSGCLVGHLHGVGEREQRCLRCDVFRRRRVVRRVFWPR